MSEHTAIPVPEEVYDVAWAELHGVLHDRASVEIIVDKIVEGERERLREELWALRRYPSTPVLERKGGPDEAWREALTIALALVGEVDQTKAGDGNE